MHGAAADDQRKRPGDVGQEHADRVVGRRKARGDARGADRSQAELFAAKASGRVLEAAGATPIAAGRAAQGSEQGGVCRRVEANGIGQAHERDGS